MACSGRVPARGTAEVLVLSPLRNSSSPDSWFQRVAENLQELATRKPSVAAPFTPGPLHFCWIDLSARTGNAQALSAVFHVALCCLALTVLASTSNGRRIVHQIESGQVRELLPYFPPADTSATGQPSLGHEGGGGENDPRPARRGNLAPGSS